MKQTLITVSALVLLLGCTATTPSQPDQAFVPLSDEEQASLEGVEVLGRLLFEKDIRAAAATELLLSRIYPDQYPNFVGWVTYPNDEDYTVSFYQYQNDQFRVMADVVFDEQQVPGLKLEPERALTDSEISMITARIQALGNGVTNCADQFNTVVVPGEQSDQWDVYVLAATLEPDEIVVGGHTKISVTRSGEVVDRQHLSKSCLVLSKSMDDLPEDTSLSMLTMSHVVSDYPIAIHSYLNLLHQIPFAVMTQRGLWFIHEGEIELMNPEEREP